MLQIKNVSKQYKTGELVQIALDNVSLNLRDNEFVSILGPSGSGKTTLLNIIGGLDRYDSGDLIINNVSTKDYKDRDWDSYRNHTIGFVFQSYNLIPHQSVLSNVELALTIGGISKKERRDEIYHNGTAQCSHNGKQDGFTAQQGQIFHNVPISADADTHTENQEHQPHCLQFAIQFDTFFFDKTLVAKKKTDTDYQKDITHISIPPKSAPV